MYGYNIHSGMPTMHGGITGHGLSNSQIHRLANFGDSARGLFGGAMYNNMPRPMHSLGGYLLGGAGTAVKGKKWFQKKPANVAYDPATGQQLVVYRGKPAKTKKQRMTQASKLRGHLRLLSDAESDAVQYELRQGHPEFAQALINDSAYNMSVHNMARMPAYVKRQFGFKPSPRAKPDAPYYVYLNRAGKQIFVKEGSAGMARAIAKGENVQPADVQYYPPR
jgi:hypothetical protein